MNNDSYTGVQKAAILLITLGPEKAATIFKHLKEDEIEELTLEIANTRSVSPQTKEEVLLRIRYRLPQYTAVRGIPDKTLPALPPWSVAIRKRTSGKSTRKRQGTGSYCKTYSISSGSSVRIYPKDRSGTAAELYTG